MKIGIYSPYLDSLGGGERYMLTIAEYLSAKHQVEIFWDDESIIGKAYRRLSINLNRTQIVNNIFMRSQFVFKNWILSSKYDLIIFLSDGSIPFSLAKKNILHFQRPFPNVQGQSLTNKIKLARYQAIIVNSDFTKKYIDKEYGINSCVLHPPVDVKQFKAAKKKNLIISVGRFSKYFINKKQKEMVGFFRKISRQIPGWKLYLVGGVLPEDKSYFREVEQRVGDASVRLFPNEPFSNLKKHYAEAKIYWHAAGFGEDEKINPAGMEHFGISTVEAMAAGSVPVVYDGGGEREIVTHGADGFLWKTENKLTDYTLRLVDDDELRKKMAERAIERSKDFSKEKFCKTVEKLISDLNSKRPLEI